MCVYIYDISVSQLVYLPLSVPKDSERSYVQCFTQDTLTYEGSNPVKEEVSFSGF